MGRIILCSLKFQQQQQQAGGPPIATQCFMLSNMFDPAEESAPNWDQEVRDDVIEEGSKHGGFLHIIVDKASTQVMNTPGFFGTLRKRNSRPIKSS